MKVLYCHQHFSTPKGSTGIRSYEMSRRLILEGHQVTMVCGSYGGGETGLHSDFVRGKRVGKVDGIEVIEFQLAYSNADGFLRRAWIFLLFAARSIGLVFVLKFDVVFATTTPLTAGIPGIFARWLRGKPFVFEVRDLWPELPKAMGVITNPIILGLMSLLEWCSYRSATRCIGLAPGICKGIEKRGVCSSKIQLIPNGCDFDIFEKTGEGWMPDGIAESDFVAIFTGTHGIANGLDAVLDTAKELKRRNIEDIKFVLIGQGKLKSDLVERARSNNLENVVFHSPVNKIKLSGLMKRADLGLQILANIPAFYFGTSPNKFFDYISAGLPVLTNYPGWIAEMIEEHQCGFVVEPDSPAKFADALEAARNQKHLLEGLGQNAQKLARDQFDRKDLSERWVDFVVGASS